MRSELPSNQKKRFYWIICSEQELLRCFREYPNAAAVGYKSVLSILKQWRLSNVSGGSMKAMSLKYLFYGLTICVSGIRQDLKDNIKLIVERMGGKYVDRLTPSTTHLVEKRIGSNKHNAAVAMKGCKIVTPTWIFECFLNGKLMKESMFCPPIFFKLLISFTGIPSAEREEMRRLIKKYGGGYTNGLNIKCTHLIVEKEQLLGNSKCSFAKIKNIPIVTKKWIYDMIEKKGCVDIGDYVCDMEDIDDDDADSLMFQAEPDPLGWVCRSCTFLNSGDRLFCSMCNEALDYNSALSVLLEPDGLEDDDDNKQDYETIIGQCKDYNNQKEKKSVVCAICLHGKREYAVTPCGHRCLCVECKDRIELRGNCPLCNQDIHSIIKIYD